jgi:hypothetical protein
VARDDVTGRGEGFADQRPQALAAGTLVPQRVSRRAAIPLSSAAGQCEREFAGTCASPKAQRLAGCIKSVGRKRGASERRHQAKPSGVQLLKLLVESHTAISRDDKFLYGMQEVRGSNPLSSTFSQVIGMIRSLK